MQNFYEIEETLRFIGDRFRLPINKNRGADRSKFIETKTAMITQAEYETLKTHVMELKARMELEDNSFEAIYLIPEELG